MMVKPTFTEITLPKQAIVPRCNLCGCLVDSRSLHEAWHAALDARMTLAAIGL